MNDFYQELVEAYYDARAHKRNTASQLKFELNLEANLHQLYTDIVKRRYRLSPGIAFVITQPLHREIFAAAFRDQIIHHLVFNRINPYWERKFIYDSYAGRTGKGTHFGIARIKRFMRASTDNYTQTAWILKLDILGYFMHIQQQAVWEKCLRQFREDPVPNSEIIQYLLRKIIFHHCTQNVHLKSSLSDWDDVPPDKSLFCLPPDQGFPVGNLTSHLFSNIYLHDFDCFVKYQLGFKYYGRYVDDFILIDRDKSRLIAAKNAINEYLYQKLELQIHPRKIYLQPVAHGVEFLGAIIRPYYTLPGKRVVKNFRAFCYQYQRFNWNSVERQELDRIWQSYVGQLSQFRSYHLLQAARLAISKHC
ncbi:MAG: reverse transcriptase [bacterium]|nr:reverse transcriptase [bacterium]